jgi:SAM-dependent methyltransferase
MKILQRAEQIVPWVEGPRVLDIGCCAHAMKFDDPHWLHGMLRKRFPEVVGIDIRPDLIDQMRELGFQNLYLENAETFDLNRQFDTIVAGDIIEHLSNAGAFLDQVKKHLAPGGRLIVTTPYPFALFHMTYAFLKYPRITWNVEHTHWMCPQTLTELCRRAGLRPLHWDLIPDYAPGDSSLPYRAFVKSLALLGSLVPARLRNSSLLFVAGHAEEREALPYRMDQKIDEADSNYPVEAKN